MSSVSTGPASEPPVPVRNPVRADATERSSPEVGGRAGIGGADRFSPPDRSRTVTDRTDEDEDGNGDGAGDGTRGRRGPDGVGGLHHVGVATDDLAARTGLYGDLLGLPVAHEETFDGLAVAFLGTGPYVELLELVGEERAGDGRGDGTGRT